MTFRKVTKDNPLRLPEKADVRGIILHWTAGRYGQHFDDYHFSIDELGQVWQNKHSPPGTVLPHCWHRNTGSIGIAAAAMYNATSEDYGEYPVTRKQLEAMAALAAKICRKYSIPETAVLTHAEAADEDGYGPNSGACERWDLWKEGSSLHKKIAWYLKMGGSNANA